MKNIKKYLFWLYALAFVTFASYLGQDIRMSRRLHNELNSLRLKNKTLEKTLFSTTSPLQLEMTGLKTNIWQTPTLVSGTVMLALPLQQLPGINACVVYTGEQEPLMPVLIRDAVPGAKVICRKYYIQHQPKGSGTSNVIAVITGEMYY